MEVASQELITRKVLVALQLLLSTHLEVRRCGAATLQMKRQVRRRDFEVLGQSWTQVLGITSRKGWVAVENSWEMK